MRLKRFISVADVAAPTELVEEVIQLKKNKFQFNQLGLEKTIALLFFNPSLRTRLSSQLAAKLLSMYDMVLDVNHGWPLEFGLGAIMDKDRSEHVQEAAAVISQYCDLLGIRSFPSLTSQKADYSEPVLNAFETYGSKPIINLESATRHPLQGLTDMVTIAEYQNTTRPKIVLTWAPHPKALPQSVANSFTAWCLAMGHDLTITHPEGYALDPQITQGANIEYDPAKAYEGADFVYAKNWSSFEQYGQIISQDQRWLVESTKWAVTNDANFMHCLPVRRNVVVADAILDSSSSLVIQQANNRTFAAATVMKCILQHMNT
ncbi:MAG: N-acetylornithine carbamoyltransferase [Saprospiraceae bacterium]|nr:N-acetylornithine carbamoyltransferase [Saprospiraceae bacterium]